MEHELRQFKFSDLALLARYPCKGGVKFFYRARVDNLDLAVIEHPAGSIQVVLQTQSLRRGAPTPVRAGRGAFAATVTKSDKTAPVPVPAPAAENQSQVTENVQESSRPPPQHPAAKRQAVSAPSPQVHKLPEDLTRKPNPGNGDCLFYCLEGPTGQNKLALRTAIVAHLRRHTEHYKGYWSCLAPAKEDVPMTDWEQYLNELAKPGAYTSLLEIHAAARHLDRPIYISSDVMPLQVCNREGKHGPPIMLWYSSAHYELVEGSLPANAAATAINAAKSGCKGGAHPSDPSIASGRTRLSAFSEGLPAPQDAASTDAPPGDAHTVRSDPLEFSPPEGLPRPRFSRRKGGSGWDRFSGLFGFRPRTGAGLLETPRLARRCLLLNRLREAGLLLLLLRPLCGRHRLGYHRSGTRPHQRHCQPE